MGISCRRATFLVYMSKVYLLHGSGAGHQSSFLKQFKYYFESEFDCELLPITLSYMVQIECTGKKRPPPRLHILIDEVAQQINPKDPIILIGKSMGSRIIAELCASHNVQACIALGFPFYPAKKSEKHRLEHFERTNNVPYLVIQGTRDSLGSFEWVSEQSLPNNVKLEWVEGADHDFHVLRRYNVSDLEVMKTLATTCARFLHKIDTGANT